jgi:hypothetical protein
MTAVNMRGTKQDLKELNRAPVHVTGETPGERLRRASDPDEVIDLTGNPRVEGHTKDGSHTTRTQDQHARQEPDAPDRLRSHYEDPPFAPTRGLRYFDHLRFGRASKKLGVYILVRDGNSAGLKYVGEKGYKAKPETLKAKTSDQPPTEGLVAFHPDHDRTLDLLAGEPPPMTVSDLRKKPIERIARYETFEKKMKKEGYTVRGSDEGYVVVDKAGNKFHGDYDLHGVYGKDGGRVKKSKKVRAKMNQEFGADLIRHGAHDEWNLRNKEKAGRNRGPQPPVTVYTPDGEAVHLPDKAAMKKFYLEHDFDWKHAYGDYEKDFPIETH